ncbi:MAG: hypothetical protein HYR49_02475 [Gammaproteobacteria bacterium]|nr:hypothetical protein [Gammaproteobacteria bacterium]
MTPDFTDHQLGQTNLLVPLETAEQHRLATIRMAQQCHRSVHIVSRNLDPAVYDVPEFCDALVRVLLESRRMKVRVLVHEAHSIVQSGHRMLAVALKLSSFVEIRKPGADHKDYNGGMFIADALGFVTRRTADRYTGEANFNDPREATLLVDEFEEMWAKSTLDSNLRRFVI